MRGILLISIFCFFTTMLKAQGSYFNYWDSTVEYKYYSSGGYTSWNYFIDGYITKYFDGDTVINGRYYYKQYSLELDSVRSYQGYFLYTTVSIEGPKYLREAQDLKFIEFDTLANKEYIILNDSSIIYKDTLNGRFNGDCSGFSSGCSIGYIDSIVLNQRPLKRECGLWGYYPSKACLIEGIGALSRNVCIPFFSDGDYYLVCFKKQNDSINVSSDKSCNSFLTPTRRNHFTNIALPVTLKYFTAFKNNITINIKWQTANEVNVSHFNIQRSVNGKDFTAIGKVNASCCTYQFTDESLTNDLVSTTIYYRLEVVDKDGKRTYSNIQPITFDPKTPSIVIYPNPAKNIVTIQGGEVNELLIIDQVGRTIKRYSNLMQPQTLNIKQFPRGIYFIKAILKDCTVQAQKLVVD